MRKLTSGNFSLAAAALVLIGEFDVSECESIGIDLTNMGANPLSAFEIHGAASPDGIPVLLANSGFTNATWWTRWANVEPATLAAGASAMLQITVEELSRIRIYVRSTLGTTLKAAVVAWEHAR